MSAPRPVFQGHGTLVQLRKGVLQFCVLAELRRGRSYGLRLAKDLGAYDVLFANEGSLYPLLARLRKQGWVDVDWQESPSGPPRKYYSITPAGIDALAEFLRSWGPFVAQANDVLGQGRS